MSIDEAPTSHSESSQVTNSLAFDADKYLEHVEDFQMTEAQKIEFLRALWDIMSAFVRLGFGVESVLPTIFQKALESSPNELEQCIPTHEFNVAADKAAEDSEKEKSS